MKLVKLVGVLFIVANVLVACGSNNQQPVQQPAQQPVEQQPMQQQPMQQQPMQQQPMQQQPVQQQPIQQQPMQQPVQQQPMQQQPVQQAVPQQNYGYGTAVINVSLDQAKEIAVGHAGFNVANVTFVKAQQDYDDGFINYDIDFVNGNNKYEYEVSASDGRILKSEIKMVNNGQGAYIPPQPVMQNGVVAGQGQAQTIDVETAKGIAVSTAGFTTANVTFTKTKYDFDDGMPQWEIEFVVNNNKYEYEISAVNGAVIKSKVESIFYD